MTKADANKIKKIVKKIDNFKVYYNSQKEELRVMVAEYQIDKNSNGVGEKTADTNTLKILSLLTENGLRPKYKKDEKLYQGFIKAHYIVFS